MTDRFSFASGNNTAFVEELYQKYKNDPSSVDLSWQKFFEGMDFAIDAGLEGSASSSGTQTHGEGADSALVEAYINAYRSLGHRSAHLNPLLEKMPIRPDMSPEYHGLGNVDKTKKFFPVNLPSKDGMTFGEIDELLKETYCDRIGAEFRDSDNIEFVKWFQEKMESCRNKPSYSKDMKLRILDQLVKSEGFEAFLQMRYLGQKRFSVEGAEAFLPFMDVLTEDASQQGVEEICVAMAHRGRLNTLTNYIGKSYELMLKEFEGLDFNPMSIDGDVKYHMGYANEVELVNGKKMRLYLSPNPSHLEAVNPVLGGFTRARQRIMEDRDGSKVLPIVVHGDAAVAGQGIVAETVNLSALEGYKTGGTIHVILNNQVGFTTYPEESRSCVYSSGIAKFINAPVLHVNADDPEAVVWCAQLAAAYRQKFKKDIFVDIIGYRRYGHNETDEPSFTQPMMYKKIAAHPTVMNIYGNRLIAEGVLTKEEFEKRISTFRERMQAAFDLVRAGKVDKNTYRAKIPKAYEPIFVHKTAQESDFDDAIKTGVSFKLLNEVGQKIVQWPDSFKPHPKVARLFESRAKMVAKDGMVDWPFAELLAFGTLANEGHHIRLSGQDCQRGTFSSRHAVLSDFETGHRLELLNQISQRQGRVEIINSPLSEQGVLGFDFGYTVADPDALVCWEAQYGDFSNGAQIITDQFLVASEQKWKQTSGITLLLPHGYEGGGPEHSSARPERFLQLCGNLNIQVANLTTAAQYFHILRRQLKRDFRKPLVIMSPKSLLRSPHAFSPMSEFENGYFQEAIDDAKISDPKSVKRVLICTGKLFYELTESREQQKINDVAILRIEQLYPFPASKLKGMLDKYCKASDVVWVQEEPQNMGAWTFIAPRIHDLLREGVPLRYLGRRDSGTTAEGTTKAHVVEQARIINEALNTSVTPVGNKNKSHIMG